MKSLGRIKMKLETLKQFVSWPTFFIVHDSSGLAKSSFSEEQRLVERQIHVKKLPFQKDFLILLAVYDPRLKV